MLRVECTSNLVAEQQSTNVEDFEVVQARYRAALKWFVESLPYSKLEKRDAIYTWMGRRIIPSLGRSLCPEDVGQDFVRVIPQKRSGLSGRIIDGLIVPQPKEYDYSYSPRHDATESFIRRIAIKLTTIANGRVWFDTRMGHSSFSYKPDENVWCTVEEFLAFREINPGKSISLQEYYSGAEVSS